MEVKISDPELRRSRRMVLGEMLARSARRAAEAVALRFGDETRTYAELDRRVNRLANALAQRGVGYGDAVGVLMYNSIEVLESYFACLKLGAMAVPMNFRLTPGELAYIFDNSTAQTILTDHALVENARAAAEQVPAVRLIAVTGAADVPGVESYEALLAEGGDEEPEAEIEEGDIAFIMYTSGTTGRPKGAMLTHLNLIANTINWSMEMEAREGDVWLSGLPLFHIGGLNGVLPFLYLSSTCVITPSTSFDALDSLRLIEKHRVTMCYFVPTQWQEICLLPEVAEIDTSVLRRALWGASQAPVSTLELLTASFPSVGIVNAFGQTEMSSNTTFLKADDAVRKMGSVGLPAVNVEVRIVDEEGVDVGVDEVGEIVYRGPTVMAGYFRNPEATEEAFAGGWFHSGDMVRRDADGFIYVVDRVKDMIISGGENIYPAEVERALATHPAVAEAAVFGVPHERWISTPAAAVVLAEGAVADPAELIEFSKEHLASYKKPTVVVFVDALPRNASGKVLKRVLREDYESGKLR